MWNGNPWGHPVNPNPMQQSQWKFIERERDSESENFASGFCFSNAIFFWDLIFFQNLGGEIHAP